MCEKICTVESGALEQDTDADGKALVRVNGPIQGTPAGAVNLLQPPSPKTKTRRMIRRWKNLYYSPIRVTGTLLRTMRSSS
jgi:hypothetical protein